MIEKEYIELINKDIDNTITESEKERLNEYLSKNGEMKDYYDDLLMINEYLKKIPDPEPSPNLSKRIINSINFNKYSSEIKKNPGIFNFFQTAFGPKLAYTLLGLIIGIFLYAVFTNDNPFNKNDIRGTIGAENPDVIVLKEVKLNTKDLTGTIELKNSGNKFWFDIDFYSDRPFEMEVNYPNNVRFVNFMPDLTDAVELTKNNNLIKVRFPGSKHVNIYFTKYSTEDTSLYFEIEQAGVSLLQQKFSLN